MATLSPRQEALYNHTVNLYEPTTAIVAGKPQPTQYTKHAGVRCRGEIRSAPDAPTFMGRAESDFVDAVDLYHFAEEQPIGAGWFIHNLTLNWDDGTPSEWYDRWWIVRGNPRKFIRSQRRRGGKKSIPASQESRPPDGLPF